MKKRLLVLPLLLVVLSNYAQLTNSAKFAIINQDLESLKKEYLASNDECQKSIVDAISNNAINWAGLTYEQIIAVVNLSKPDDPFDMILNQQLKKKEFEIINTLKDLDAEQIGLYSQYFPNRTGVIVNFMNDVLTENLDSIPYMQLDYLQRKLHINGYDSIIEQSYNMRSAERIKMVRDHLDKYCIIEASYRDRLVFLLRATAWKYLYKRFEGVCESYSQIGIVSDIPYYIGEQFRDIVDAYFTSKDFTKQLKRTVDSYNASINKSRAKFATDADIVGYPQSTITVPPVPSFAYKDDYDILNIVPNARQSFIDSRETAGTIANIASFFVGSLVSTIGKGLFDLNAASKLAEDEIEGRRKLMDDVFHKLCINIENYCNRISSDIDTQIKNNQLKFKSYVQSYQ